VAEALALQARRASKSREAQDKGGGSGQGGHAAAQKALTDLADHLAEVLGQQEREGKGEQQQQQQQQQGRRGGGVVLRALCALHALRSVGCIAPQVFAGEGTCECVCFACMSARCVFKAISVHVCVNVCLCCLAYFYMLSLSHTHTHTLTYSFDSQTHTYTLTQALQLIHTRTHTHTLTHTSTHRAC